MIQTSQAYRDAIVGSPREMMFRAVVDISDPDMVISNITYPPYELWSKPQQLLDKQFDTPPRYGTLELDYWRLDGSYSFFPPGYQVPGHTSWCGTQLSGPDGSCQVPPVFTMEFTKVSILQNVAIYFSDDPDDGVGEDVTVEVFSPDGGHALRTVTGNKSALLNVYGFTVYEANRVVITITKWSKPERRGRVIFLYPGLYEWWEGDELEQLSVQQQADPSCLSVPFGSANVGLDNFSRRFDPRREDSVFKSIQEKQSIDILMGPRTDAGVEWIRVGTYYQTGDGWKTSENEPTLKWYLVDIIGLVRDRTFLVPDVLPTTLEGWIRAIVSQLGENFSMRYRVDPDYANKAVTANSREDVANKKCGDILKWACQATGTWPRAAADTGYLAAEPLWNQGCKYELDNLEKYPEMKANKSLAALIFQLALPPLPEGEEDTRQREYVVSGNSTSSEDTVTIINPFIHTQDQALEAARLILSQYGGFQYIMTGRGDPSSEIGDVDTIWLDESNAATARRIAQTFQVQGGVLRGCQSTSLQADGSYLYTEYAVIRYDTVFVGPPGVTKLRIVLGRGGQGSGPGGPGWIGRTGNLGNGLGSGYGDPGADGRGGEIWYGVIEINEGQSFEVHLGEGGAPGTVVGQPGALGGHTTFGRYSSEEGQLYPNGYTDIANGQSFARTGVPEPAPGTGDGAKGGAGGDPGEGYIRWVERRYGGSLKAELVVTKPPGPGQPGQAGATGFAMVTWEKPGT